MSTFSLFAKAVEAQFALMSKHELYVVNVDRDVVYQNYLDAFPEGTNPIFRARTEHDCSCCRQFIKNIGNVVAIINGQVVTIWDTVSNLQMDDALYPYNIVAYEMQTLVRYTKVDTIFRTVEAKFGAAQSHELRAGKTHTWNHLHGTVAAKHRTDSPGEQRGEWEGHVQVFRRGLEELTPAAIQTVSELIAENNLYKGAEFKAAVNAIGFMKDEYEALEDAASQDLYIIANAQAKGARIRNTAIGTLLIDLSGIPARDATDAHPAREYTPPVDLERAVKSYEDKVSGTNYKRPTALVTEGMKKKAMQTIQEAGYEEAIQRRAAMPSDVSITNVKWADNSQAKIMKGALESIMDSVPAKKAVKELSAREVSFAEFMELVLPVAKSIKAQVKGRHLGNMVALSAPVHEDSKNMFKWGNKFGWAYTGNVTDSIKERVKQAGGKTDAVLRVSLSWHNGDDLDLHAIEPDYNEVYFANRHAKSVNSGQLDVDMNAGRADNSINPVENITWSKPGDGQYRIDVKNFSRRSTSNTGFTLEVESKGNVMQYSSDQSPANGGTIKALYLTVKDGVVTEVVADKAMRGESIAQTQWGITTNELVPVTMIMNSPNHWDGEDSGHKHFMFMLEGCKADEPMRGIMNEFLNNDFEQHRKVMELLGEKTKFQPVKGMLAGLGFSETKGDSIVLLVTTATSQRQYTVVF